MKQIVYSLGDLYSVVDNKTTLLTAKSLCNGKRYISLRLGGRTGKTVYAHRYIWEMFNGPIPNARVIDHINGDTLDNRIENLQCVTQRENLEKQGMRSDNKTGIPGIYFCAPRKYFAIDVTRNSKRLTKRFPTLAAAKQYLQHHLK